jgi:thiamine biosynthesis protein ThiI
MKFIVKLFPEILVKSKPVRRRFAKILESNLRNVLRRVDETTRVKLYWDKIEVRADSVDPEICEQLVETLKSTPGVDQFSEVVQSSFVDLQDAFEKTLAVWKEPLTGKTFCVRIRRVGKHDFTSIDAERYIGGGLNKHSEALGVKLKDPDLTIRLEIDGDRLFVVKSAHPGLGGFPIGTQDDVLSLLSGGYDSGVSSYQMIKRGARTHYCFFNLGGAAHEIGVRQVACFLWNKYAASHRVKFVSVSFEPVVSDILEKVDNGLMGVVLKRMMMRAAAKIAERLRIEALVTGEAIGQVSSQTLANLSVIDRTVDTLILRPLTAFNKQDIIDTAREIGTAEFAETIPEYCGVISNRPTVKAIPAKVIAEEANMDMSVLDRVINQAQVIDIKQILEESDREVVEVEAVSLLAGNAVVLDIRSPDEEDENPLKLEGVEIMHIPFYKLSTRFADLDQSRDYHLYCEKGVMSKLQALYLHEQGYLNVKVYHPHHH